MFGKVAGEFFVDQGLDDPFHLAVSQLRLGLAFKLRLRDFHADHRCQSLADIFSLKILLVLLKNAALDRIVIDCSGEG